MLKLEIMNTKIISVVLLFCASFLFGGQTACAENSDWLAVGNDRQSNISGMALVEHNDRQTSFIVVHDNKKKKQSRAGLVTVGSDGQPQSTTLSWLGSEMPLDLEGITKIPDTSDGFMAITSAGKVYHLAFDRNANAVSVIKSFDVPSIPLNGNFEGFALQKIGDAYLAVWAERGEDAKPGTIFWSKFDLPTYAFLQSNSVSVKVPYPVTNVRHISDVKVDEAGKVFISSAADTGNDGPFASAVYLAGKLKSAGAANFTFDQVSQLDKLFSVNNRKIEAFELLPEAAGGMVFGTDDENLGSAIYFGRQKINATASLRF